MIPWRPARWLADFLASVTKSALPPGPSKPDAAASCTIPPQVHWEAGGTVAMTCPNCHASSLKSQVLTVDFRALHQSPRNWHLLDCPDCSCRFFSEPLSGTIATTQADYGDDEMLTRGRAALYLQHGAGLAQLIRPIAGIDKPATSRMLDIGCGFGFGLDFAIRVKGWCCLGIDPAQIAAMGREQLGLPIEQRMLGADEPTLRGAFDVVMAAETIEHMPDPAAFLAILVSTLAPSGILVLTTPDAEAIHPEAPAGQLAGLLSPGLHIVLQSERSLRRLLAEAGLPQIHIDHDGGALVATASRDALTPSHDDAGFGRSYLDYLASRSTAFPPGHDLFWGFTGRAFLEAVNRAAWPEAAALRARLAAACQQVFALSLDDPRLFDETAGCSLERMAALMPLNFGIIVYADAMRELGQGAGRPSQTHRFEAAAEALRRLNRAVGELGMADPMSEEIGWAAEAESLVCAAASAPDDSLVARLAALATAKGEHGFGRREAMRLQAFVTLVNAAHYDLARALAERLPELSAPLAQQGRDAIYCRAMLALQPPADPAHAHTNFAWLREQFMQSGKPTDMPLFWSALRGEAQALDMLDRHDDAVALLQSSGHAMATLGEAVPADLGPATRLPPRIDP